MCPVCEKAVKTVTGKAISSGGGSHITLGEEKSDKQVLNDFLIRKVVSRERNHATRDARVQEKHTATSCEDDFVMLFASATNPSRDRDKCPYTYAEGRRMKRSTGTVRFKLLSGIVIRAMETQNGLWSQTGSLLAYS